MAKKSLESDNAAKLRSRAEENLKAKRPPAGRGGTSETERLVHELQVHQIELEMQNEELGRAREAVETTLKRYSDLYDFAPVGYFTLGARGEILQTNLYGARLLGAERATLQNKAFAAFVAAADRPAFNKFLGRVLTGEGHESCELALDVGRAGRKAAADAGAEAKRQVRIDATPRESDGAGPTCSAVAIDITDDIRARQLEKMNRSLESKTAELARQAGQLRMLGAELAQAENRERRRLAGLLHDDLQQLLAAAKFTLSSLKPAEGDEKLAGGIAQVKDVLTQCIAASRALTAELAPPVLHHGSLADALVWLARRMLDMHGLEVEIRAAEPIDVPPDLRHMLYQSVRELLCNVVKHSGAKQATVALEANADGRLTLEVNDQGDGIPADRLAQISAGDAGIGLFSIRERLEAIGGTLTIASEPGRGARATIVAWLPATPLTSSE